MSIIKLTKDLVNFQWTDYDNIGDNTSQISGRHGGTLPGGQPPHPSDHSELDDGSGVPQSFYDGHSQVVTGQKKFDRPDKQALADMESRFGPLNTQPGSRGPYSVADYMYGRKQGRGFTAPGQAPLGFTVDMESLTGGVTSQLDIDDSISLTPLSYVVAGVNSSLDYGVVPEKTIDITPDAHGAWGVETLPISTYTSRILSREELEDYTSAPVGGRGVSYYGRLESVYNKDSMFQKSDGTYTTPIGQSTIPGSQTEFQNFMEYGGRGIQRTFEISREYPNNTTAYTIDTQFGTTFENKLLESHGSAVTPDIPSDKYGSLPAMIDNSPLELLFYLNWNESNNVWPYHTHGFTGTHPLVKKEIGDRIPIGGGQDWMALQSLKTADDTTRINKWLETSKGKAWQEKQHVLQFLNPREETRDWSRSNLILSIPPLFHATRHWGGETYMEKADFGPIFEGVPPSDDPTMGSLTSGAMSALGEKIGKSESWKKMSGEVSRITAPVGAWASNIGKDISTGLSSFAGAIAGSGVGKFFGKAGSIINETQVNFNTEGGRLTFLLGKMVWHPPGETLIGGAFSVALTNLRSSQTPFGRPPKVPTQTVFSQRGAYGKGRAHEDIVGNESGNLLQSYKGVAYGNIGQILYKGTDSPYKRDLAPIEPIWEDVRPNNLPDLSDPNALKGSFKTAFDSSFSQNFHALNQLGIMTNRYNVKKGNKEETDALIDAWPENRNKPMNSLGDPSSKTPVTVGDTSKGDRGGADLGLIKKDGGSKSYRSMATDKINIHPYGTDLPDTVSDFIKFKFKDIVNNKFIVFRAILSGISDAISPDWSGTQYIGRPDKVYVYKGAERKVSFTFEIFPKTKQEFPVLMEKLNYLIGLCYPSFTPDNRMIAPFIELTLGDMFKNTPGFLDSLSVDVDDNSPWELDEGLQFPKHITCQCSFTYIGKYMPSTLGKHYELDWLNDTGWSKVATVSKGTFVGDDMISPQRTEPMSKLFEGTEPPQSN